MTIDEVRAMLQRFTSDSYGRRDMTSPWQAFDEGMEDLARRLLAELDQREDASTVAAIAGCYL